MPEDRETASSTYGHSRMIASRWMEACLDCCCWKAALPCSSWASDGLLCAWASWERNGGEASSLLCRREDLKPLDGRDSGVPSCKGSGVLKVPKSFLSAPLKGQSTGSYQAFAVKKT